MSVRNFQRWLLLTGLVLAGIWGVVNVWFQPRNVLVYFTQRRMVLQDTTILNFIEKYIRTDLPAAAQQQFAFAAPDHKGARLFVVQGDSIIGHNGFQPFNALYDRMSDAIFLDVRLVNLARQQRNSGGGRTLLAFVLLHELGHRTLHRNKIWKADFVDIQLPAINRWWNGWMARIGIGAKKNLEAEKREVEADSWAVDQYLQLLPMDSAKIFVREPDSLPLLNLVEGGFLTAISQNGPYSPIVQGNDHPSIYSRVLHYYYALSQSPRIRPSDRLFYAIQGMTLQKFLQHLERYLGGVIVLAQGDMPMSAAVVHHRLWIMSYRNYLYEVDWPFSTNPTAETQVPAMKTNIFFPPGTEDYQLLAIEQHLFLISTTHPNVYRLNETTARWEPWGQWPGEKLWWQPTGACYSSQYISQDGQLLLYHLDLDHQRTSHTDTIDCKGILWADDYTLAINQDRRYLCLLDELGTLNVYKVASGRARFWRAFEKVGEYEMDEWAKYLLLSYDRQEAPAVGHLDAHYDRFARPYLVNSSKGQLYLQDVGPFIRSIDLLGLDTPRTIAQDLLLNADSASLSASAQDRRDLDTVSVLYKEFYSVLDQQGVIRMNDDILRHPNLVFSTTMGQKRVTLTDIPYSRYLLVFDFSQRRPVSEAMTFRLTAIDL